MNLRKSTHWVVVAWLVLASASPSFAADFVDPLDQPVRPSSLASRTLLLSVTRAGARLVAAGQRGHIIYSDDQGASWKQAAVPVSSDLTAVCFVNASTGWAVGHDGVILRSRDGGASWIKQLDGRQANALLVADLEKKAGASPDSERIKRLLAEAMRYRDAGPDKPLLDVWFSDENTGYAVGAYNLIFRTDDGGEHWESWFDRTDNPNLFHLNAIRGIRDQVYVVGEQGLFLRLDASAHRFVASPTSAPYKGSFFALAATQGGQIAFGMRGNAYRTADEGKTWQKIEMGVGSGLSGASVLDDGRIVAVSQTGQVLLSKDGGSTFAPVEGIRPMPFAGVVSAGPDRIALAGTQGIRVEQLP